MKTRRFLLSILLVVAASDAAAKKFVPTRPVAAELPVEVYLPQEGIFVDIPPTGTGGGVSASWLAQGVASGRAERAGSRTALVQALFDGYDFKSRFEQQLRRKLPADITPLPHYRVVAAPLETYGVHVMMLEDAQPPENVQLGRVLKVQGKWAMAYTLQKMYVRTSLYLVDRVAGPNGKFKEAELLSRSYTFEIPLSTSGGIKPETNARRWHAIGSQELRRLLDLAIEQSTDMLAYDFSAEGRGMLVDKAGFRETSPFRGQEVDGRVFRESQDWYWTYPTRYYDTYMPSSIVGVYVANPEALAPRAASQAPGQQ